VTAVPPADVPVPSPCIGICTLDATRACIGCGRTIAEIAEWPRATEMRRRAIVDAARRRRPGAPASPARS
jgi:predicted Fe-S protein YdhL (DUF1289 family)